ncbi:copper chaperone CopZ [Bacillus sp. ISL-47]|uniref:copper chaperone CopZ n=1 Tax=Bacillus sp. ISL-47 TaxID=2819130 RepID=UPI001BEBCA25|nr:copper chaperone CopZ [Bacillus sp. ISL-47]MBT2689979.1 copper chaperone CopZ [Bacillus sp. ISL-47]MBT2709347.1 copper chaperone CopZ [Pseudomonas sp. ISL-84]
MENVTLKVSGMSCGHCVKAVEGSVGKLNGVEKVSVDLDNGQVQVQYDSSSVSLESIKETIDDQGYDVE